MSLIVQGIFDFENICLSGFYLANMSRQEKTGFRPKMSMVCTFNECHLPPFLREKP